MSIGLCGTYENKGPFHYKDAIFICSYWKHETTAFQNPILTYIVLPSIFGSCPRRVHADHVAIRLSTALFSQSRIPTPTISHINRLKAIRAFRMIAQFQPKRKGLVYQYKLISIPAWINNRTPSKVLYEIIYPIPKFQRLHSWSLWMDT